MGLAWNICAPLGTLSTFFFNPVFQVSTAKNEINLFNNHILIEAPVTFAPAGAMTPSAEFLYEEHYENTPIQIYRTFYHQKKWKFSDKKFWYFLISAQNTDWRYSLELPRWGGSNEYPQSMFLSRNKKNNVYPCKPQFYYIKVGFKGVKII